MASSTTIDLNLVARPLRLPRAQVEATVALLDAGNTVPFITRYRKDQTGGLDEEQVREVQARVALLRQLAERKQTILRSIDAQGKLTPELAAQIEAADTLKRLEDLYLPFKPKKQTLATTARERGLEPLAREILTADPLALDLDRRGADFVNPDRGVATHADALLGAGHILSEQFSERADLRQRLRGILHRTGALVSKVEADLNPEQTKLSQQFRDYFEYREALDKVPPHRVLAINRGERAKLLRVKIEADQAVLERETDELLVPPEHPHGEFLRACGRDALARLVLPSLERELRREMTDRAEEHAVTVFARNLRQLFLQRPVRGRRVLAIDPGFKSGCKLAALDAFGNLLAWSVVHLVGKQGQRDAARAKLLELVNEHELSVVAIGNGTGCRQTEELVADLLANELKDRGVDYVIVNEAGASVYSASPLAREEFPDHDATQRGTISIGRRLQDPLSELVKIDAASIGVGMYQHDVKAKHLRESLDAVVESCVNYVGVDLNTASPALLRYVSGLNQLTARRLYDYRREHGPFKNREALREVPGFGEATFTQAAGFLKIDEGDNPLDTTWIHPESYEATRQILARLGWSEADLVDKQRTAESAEKLATLDPAALATELNVGEHTLRDILANLARPGRDPREDLPPPVFKQGILKLEDLIVGMELSGAVLNVVDFGAFVDIGLTDSGLVHISELADKFVSNPHEVVAVGDIVKVWVLSVDKDRRRVSLTMIPPGSRKGPAERSGRRGEEGAHPPSSGEAASSGRPARVDRPAGGRPSGGGRKPRQHGHKQAVGAGTARSAAYESRPPRKTKPPVAVKLTKSQVEGKDPLHSFAALKVLLDLKSQDPPAESK
ncbi:MAG: helix-hairpin-helix domain-containing protein [Planctomycetaceae bacterium]|nr:helix-hairpin-helix domain-containing protein [Planctomycetaceae bacterium]